MVYHAQDADHEEQAQKVVDALVHDKVRGVVDARLPAVDEQ